MMKETRSWRGNASDKRARLLITAVIVVSSVVSWWMLDINLAFVAGAPVEIADLANRLYPPDWTVLNELVSPTVTTLEVTILGTLLALVLALPVAILSAQNITYNKVTYYFGKFIISSTRSINVIIWALIFVAIYGPGALAGVFAIAVRSIGFTAKLLAESFEELDRGQVEAVSATGASRIETFVYGIIPQIKPAFITVSTFRWEINIRAATVIGLVGAGGIGVPLLTFINSFRWSAVLTTIIIILLMVLIAEAVSIYMRRWIRRSPG